MRFKITNEILQNLLNVLAPQGKHFMTDLGLEKTLLVANPVPMCVPGFQNLVHVVVNPILLRVSLLVVMSNHTTLWEQVHL
jgi:pseudouridine-5'-phosphate glycosidase